MFKIENLQLEEISEKVKNETWFEEPKEEEYDLLNEITDYLHDMRWVKKRNRGKVGRKNIYGEEDQIIEAFTLGLSRRYDKKELVNSQYNKKYEYLFSMLKELVKIHNPDFLWNCIQLNKNVITKEHFDKNNNGKSYCIGLGNYKGGGIDGVVGREKKDGVWVDKWEHYSNNYLWLNYNGKYQKHKSSPIESGDRYAIIFFYRS